MIPILVKSFGPILIFVLWIVFAMRARSIKLAMAALFFAGFAALSQNFTFFYREIFQVIQIVMIISFLIATIQRRRIFGFNSIFFVLLVFIIGSLFFSKLDSDAKAQLVNILVVIGVVNSLYEACGTTAALDKIMKFVAVLALCETFFGVLEFVTNFGVRVEGTFANANYYALFLGFGFCVVYERNSGIKRILLLSFLLFGIIASGSRAGFIMPVLQIFWYLYRLGKTRLFIIYGMVSVALILGVVASGLTRVSDAQASEDSDAERIIFAKIALRMASDHPITGVGWGRYVSEFGNYSSGAEEILTASGDVDVSKQDRRVTHNDLVRIVAELGWIALLVTLFCLIRGLVRLPSFKTHRLAYVAPIWLGMMLFSLAHNNLNGALFWFFFVMPFYFHKMKAKAAGVVSRKKTSLSIPREAGEL